MTMGIVWATAAILGSLLDIQTLPWRGGESTVMVADFDSDGRGEVGIITDNTLQVFGRTGSASIYTIPLPAGTSAIDVFDTNADGESDIVVVAGEDIFCIPLNAAVPETPPPSFSRENVYSHYRGKPFPAVLSVVKDDTPLMALPCEGALELRGFDGTLVASFPVGVHAPRHLALGQPFSVLTNQHAQSGAAGALEFRINSVATYKPILPDDTLPVDIAKPSGRVGTPRQQREAMTLVPDRWPWFSVGKFGEREIRALYARMGIKGEYTTIRIRHLSGETTSGAKNLEETGPPRHYPGLLLGHPTRQPDFDGDGFHDLLLWKSKRISTSADSIARATTRGTWPIRLIAHTYAPKKERFTAKSMGHVELEIPLAWHLASGSSSPLRVFFLHDLDGDGRTDLGCLPNDDSLAVWRARPNGFPGKPDFFHQFPGKVNAVLFETDLEGQGRTSIGLEGTNSLYVLRPGDIPTP